jgi:2-polyprenyl-3-methyl-5-hydroxy-6-metoxy-1,4-benzoquinol methylase
MSDAPSIDAVLAAFTGYQRTAVLRAAVDLDVFTRSGEGADTVAALAARCGASERGVRSLCDHLVVDGLLRKDADGRYALSATAAGFLDRRSEACIASMVDFLASDTIVAAFAHLTEAVRRGGTALADDGTLGEENPVWVQFARAMAPAARLQAEVLASILGEAPPVHRVLDVAAGHGLFGIAVAKRHPEAQVTALDWRNVLGVARENVERAGLAARWRALPGSAFDVDWGTGYDLVLVTHLLHHFDRAGCETLLRRAHAALAPGGRLAILEFVPNADRVTPPNAAAFSLVMLATTPHGDAYTFDEYRAMLAAAGFADPVLHSTDPLPAQVIVASR